MSLNPNNQPEENQVVNSEVTPIADTDCESTIFSAPEEKRDRDVKKTNRKGNIIVSVAAVVVLAAIITAVAIFIPKIVDNTASDLYNTTPLTEYNYEDVNTVTVKSQDQQNTYYSKVELTELDGQSKRYVYWHIKSVAERLSDSDKIEELVMNVTSLKGIRDMGADTGEYGLQTPSYVIDVAARDNAFEDYTITVGNTSPDNTGVYVTVSGKENVWLVDVSVLDQYKKVPTDYADTTAVKALTETGELSKYFEDGTLTTCDSIVLYNNTFTSPLTFVPNDIESTKTYATYIITSPVERFAEKANELLNIAANGLVGDGVYVFNPTDEDIKNYGLNNPTATLDIKFGDTVISLKAAPAPDEKYYVLIDQDKEAIYKVYYNSLKFAENPMSYYYNKFLTMEMLTGLSNITVQTLENKYDFSITYFEDLEDGEDFDILLNGTELDQTSFQNYYQVFLGLEIIEYSTNQITSPAVYSFTMKHNDKNIPDTVLKLYKHTDQRYIAEVNGNQMGLISATAYNKLISYFNMLIAGEDVPRT